MDEPYRMDYVVSHIADNDIIRIDFKLGFRVAPRINLMFRKVVQDLIQHNEVDITSKYESLNKNNISGDFKFIIVEKYLSFDNDLPFLQRIVMDLYYFIKKYSLSESRAFGLESSLLKVEKFPMIFSTPSDCSNLRRLQ
jgi:KUP system potassium uptake protein